MSIYHTPHLDIGNGSGCRAARARTASVSRRHTVYYTLQFSNSAIILLGCYCILGVKVSGPPSRRRKSNGGAQVGSSFHFRNTTAVCGALAQNARDIATNPSWSHAQSHLLGERVGGMGTLQDTFCPELTSAPTRAPALESQTHEPVWYVEIGTV